MVRSPVPILQDEPSFENNEDGRPLLFPFRVHQLLSQAGELGFGDVVSWNKNGTKLVIYDLKRFTSKILPTVFRQSQFASFRRQMNAYGFKRETMLSMKANCSPASTLILYSHRDFRRDEPAACARITRKVPALKRQQIYPRLGHGSSKLDYEYVQWGLSPLPRSNDACRMLKKRTNDEAKQEYSTLYFQLSGLDQSNIPSLEEKERYEVLNPTKCHFKAFDDDLDEIADVIFNDDLPDCADVNGIDWDMMNESLNSLLSLTNSKAA